jgi:hypothetical protein
LGSLSGGNSSAGGLNEKGQVVVNSSDRYSNLRGRSYLWENGKITDLVSLLHVSTSARDINENGQILGQYINYSQSAPGDGSFLWEKGEAVDLKNLIAPNSGWEYLGGLKINKKGQIIGYGVFQGQGQAFIMNPTDQIIDPELISEQIPEPSTIIGSILGIGTLVNTARRRKGKQQS